LRKPDPLIAASANAVEHLQSGTWSTVRYARRSGRPISIIRPDGTVVRKRSSLSSSQWAMASPLAFGKSKHSPIVLVI